MNGALIGAPDLVLTGYAGSGKSTVAKFLEELGYQRFAFAGVAEHPHAGSVRDIVTQLWGPDAVNDREKLVIFGNAGRAADENVWLNSVRGAMDTTTAPVVVDDARFENEFYGLKGDGFVSIRITAPLSIRMDRLRLNGKLPSSAEYFDSPIEHQLDDVPTDYTIENEAGIHELLALVEHILDKERRRR